MTEPKPEPVTNKPKPGLVAAKPKPGTAAMIAKVDKAPGKLSSASSTTAVAEPPFKLLRAQFSTAITGNEPLDRIERMTPPSDKAVFFTELEFAKPGTVIHRWSFQGEVRGEVRLPVRKGRYRTWSVHSFSAAEAGRWTVAAVDPEGRVLASRSLVYAP